MTGRDEKESTPNHEGEEEEIHVLFKPLFAVTFAGIPWAKASCMDEPIVRMGVCFRFFAFNVICHRYLHGSSVLCSNVTLSEVLP